MISIIVPLFNYAHFIGENIESIQKQTYEDWELIIVDDHSRDKPHRVIRNYKDDRIKYIRHEHNLGYGVTKNTGIRASRGDYIVVLDADDTLTTDSLEIRLGYLKNKPKKLWIHARAWEFLNKKPYKFRFKKRKSIRRLANIIKTRKYATLWENIHAQTVMIHRSVYEKVGLYEPSLLSMGDKEMWARIISNIGIPFYTKKFVSCYRMHSAQMHRSEEKKKNLKKYMKILDRCMDRRAKGDLSGVETL